MGKPIKPSLREMVRQMVCANGPVTCSQVHSALGKQVTSAQAMRAYRRCKKVKRSTYSMGDPVEYGSRNILSTYLYALCKQGKIRRVAKATYTKPLKKGKAAP